MIEENKNFIQHIETLKHCGAKSIKLELESEYLPESLCKEIVNTLKQNSIPLTLKLGGFSSYNDILVSKNIDAANIIAPMVETPYALQKYIETIFCIYSKEELQTKKIFINIETDFGIKNFNEIIKSKYANLLDGIIIGRGDLISSLNIEPSLVNSSFLKDIITPVIKTCKKEKKKVILGGNITPDTIDFINLFEKDAFFGFETRMVFFKLENFKQDTSIKEAIKKAIEFEIFYLQMTLQTCCCSNIEQRISALQKRLIN